MPLGLPQSRIARLLLGLCLAALLASCVRETSTDAEVVSPQAASSDAKEANADDAALGTLVIDGAAADTATLSALSSQKANVAGKVRELFQYPELPSGCELCSLTMVLNAYGLDVGKTELADDYLVVDGTEEGFLNSPYEENGGCFPPGIVKVAQSYLDDKGISLAPHDTSGSPFEALCALVRNGRPVIVWTTLSLNEPNYDPGKGATSTWYVNEHCVVLCGVEGDSVVVSDPLQGKIEHDLAQFKRAYEQCEYRSVALW